MDYGTALAVWLGFVAVAVTVTPKITNRWAAAGAWMLTILYSAWLFGSRRAEALAFFGQHPTLLALGVGGIALICLMALRERDRRVKRFAAEAEAAAESERQRQFESFPAELGMYEHAKNLKESLDAFPPLMHRMAPVVVKIGAEVMATVDRFPPKSDPDFIDKKAAVISQAARGPLHDLVSELERDATAYLGKADLFATSFRHFLTIPIRSDSDRETLGDMRDVFARHAFVEMFGKLGEVFEQKANAMLKLHGHTQDMNRIVGRYTQAMGKVRDANRKIHDFSTGELVTAVSAKLDGKPAEEPRESATEAGRPDGLEQRKIAHVRRILDDLATLRSEAITGLYSRVVEVVKKEEVERYRQDHLAWRKRVLAILTANFRKSFYGRFEDLGEINVTLWSSDMTYNKTRTMVAQRIAIIDEWLALGTTSVSALVSALSEQGEQAALGHRQT